jgi:hypothetical protein
MKSKKSKSRENENENIESGHVFTNFNHYFEEFYKMFNHCKYNLVAVNKKFDALEAFFKNYILRGKSYGNSQNSNELESSQKVLKKNGSNKRSNSNFNYDESTPDIKTEKEENFPISIEDLDYLTKNYITEETNGNCDERNYSNNKNKNSSSRKKKNQTENVITIKKKDVQLDESLVEFFGKNNIEEEDFKELPVQIDKNTENNFVQKLFDYKTFSQSIKKSEKENFNKENNELNNENESSKWITRNELDSKSTNGNNNNYDNFVNCEKTFSLNQNFDFNKKNENKIENENMTEKKKTKFSDFCSNYMKANLLSDKKNFVPNLVMKDEKNNSDEDEQNKNCNENRNLDESRKIFLFYFNRRKC